MTTSLLSVGHALGLAAFTTGALLFPRIAAAEEPAAAGPPFPKFGSVERLDDRLDEVLSPDASMERLATGFEWSEGPVWVPQRGVLLFSDIPRNSIYQWDDRTGLSLFLKPSGYTGTSDFTGTEPGSNGLTLDAEGRLVLCQHGDRKIARLGPDNKSFETLADRYEGKRFNSPNDLVYKSNGDLYFTDPPYGLPRNVDDPARELDFQGVYRLSRGGELTLLTKEMSRPNGIAFSPDEKTLYVANSDPERAIWMAFPVQDDGTLGAGKVLFDATGWVGKEKGLPDGMVVSASGYLFATGPGGVLILAPDGKHLGTLKTGEATANCTLGAPDGSTLYITADMHLLRIPTRTRAISH